MHHSPISSLTNLLQNHRVRINKKTPEGPNPIHNPPISILTDPLQNHRARINKQIP